MFAKVGAGILGVGVIGLGSIAIAKPELIGLGWENPYLKIALTPAPDTQENS